MATKDCLYILYKLLALESFIPEALSLQVIKLRNTNIREEGKAFCFFLFFYLKIVSESQQTGQYTLKCPK